MAHAEPRQSYGQGLARPNLRMTGASNWIGRYAGVSYTRPRTFGRVGRPGRSVVASASALGAEDRRFESCRPDSVIATRRRWRLKIITECGCSSMAEPQPSKLAMRVRFSSPAPLHLPWSDSNRGAEWQSNIDSRYRSVPKTCPKGHDGPCSIRASKASAMARSRVMVRC
jgi:hypothetical protein